MPRVLVVEDEKDLNRLIAFHLRSAGFEVEQAYDAEEALSFLDTNRFDLVLLDILLPGMDGWEVCRALRSSRETRNVPVIFLTALSEESSRVTGFDLGGDDYLTKPFSPRELISRIKAILRRAEAQAPGRSERASARVGDVAIDFLQHQIRVKGQAIHLTYTEFQLLRLLITHQGRVFTRDELLAELRHSSDDLAPGNVDVHVHHLRRKLEEDPRRPQYIKTVRGVGYRFQHSDADPFGGPRRHQFKPRSERQ